MKRSPIQRKTPLKSESSLRSSKPSATGETQPAKPRRSTGKHVGEKATTDAVKERSGGDCEVRLFGICLGRATNRHHRKNRSQGGRWDPTEILHVCGSGTTGCHGALTNTNGRRQEFEQYGWIVPSHEDPAAVECLIYTRWYGHDWVLLTGEYPWVELAPWPEGKTEHPDELRVPRLESEIGGAA